MRDLLRNFFIIVIVSGASFVVVKAVDIKFQNTDSEACPREMVFIASSDGGFCIDKYEASAGKNCPLVNPRSIKDSRKNLVVPRCKAVSAFGLNPWRYISRDQAERACSQAGKRLATPREWHLAALGTDDINANCQLYNNWEEQPGRGGQDLKCVSSGGAYDMVGNLWEWTDAVVKDGVWAGVNLPQSGYIAGTDGQGMPGLVQVEAHPDYNQDYFWIKSSGLRAVAKGGYYDSEAKGGVYSTYVELNPSEVSPGIGFRCVR